MADFSVNSKFNKEANFSQVKFGADAPLLEVELNELQEIQDEARASLLREQAPSGVLNLAKCTVFTNVANSIRIAEEMRVNVCGQILTIPKNTDIVLDSPPTADFQSVTGKVGYREDLVFLEAWKEEVTYQDNIKKYGGVNQTNVTNHLKDARVGVETSRRIQWKWRIRCVSDVLFSRHKDGLEYSSSASTHVTTMVLAQGGASTPYADRTDWVKASKGAYYGANSRKTTSTSKGNKYLDDYGLYLAGGEECKDLFKSVDGFVYAIPLFKVARRNSGGYSVKNANGSTNMADALCSIYYNETGTGSGNVTYAKNDIATLLVEANSYNKMNVGDILKHQNYENIRIQVMQKLGSNKIKAMFVGSSTTTGSATSTFPFLKIDRPDATLADLITLNDITDLRHKVSVTGFNYEEVLSQSYNALLKGKLNTKDDKKVCKTYHGVRKTPVDSNTILYASFDGTTTPEVGSFVSSEKTLTFSQSPTGLGLNMNQSVNKMILNPTKPTQSNCFTLDFFVETEHIVNFVEHVSGCWLQYMTYVLLSDDSYITLSSSSSGNLYLRIFPAGNSYSIPNTYINMDSKFTHIRMRSTLDKSIHLYVNGNKAYTLSNIPEEVLSSNATIKSLQIGHISNGWEYRGIMSDVSLSCIDRGDDFSTLPQDFIDGYANIGTAFNEQRYILGDPKTSQVCCDVVRASVGTIGKHIEIKQATSGKWASGDTIKIKGLAKEFITGILDSKTALATVTKEEKTSTTLKVYLNDVSKLSVGDKIRFVDQAFLVVSNKEAEVTEVNTSEKYIKIKEAVQWETYVGQYVIETTATTSAPLIRYSNGTSLVAVSGTFSGLGTQEVTFTFETNSSLTNQDIELKYVLNTPEGQGTLYSVLTDLHGGEYLNKKLINNGGSLLIKDDFANKVKGSLTVCPNVALYTNRTSSLYAPKVSGSEVMEFPQDSYYYLNQHHNIGIGTQDQDGNIDQQMFKVNVYRMIEDKFGTIPGISKVEWLKENLDGLAFRHTGFGSGAEGYKLSIAVYNTKTSTWTTTSTNHTNSTPTLMSTGVNSTQIADYIDAEGFVTFGVYAPASDGQTRSKVITTDVYFDLTLKVPVGFEVLSPVNPRRDDGLGGALLVRRTTREVRRYQLGNGNETTNIVTYGYKMPYQGYKEMKKGTVMATNDFITLTTLGTNRPLEGFLEVASDLTYDLPIITNLPLYRRKSEYRLGGYPLDYLGFTSNARLSDTTVNIKFCSGEGYRNKYNPPIPGDILQIEDAYTTNFRGQGRYVSMFRLATPMDEPEAMESIKIHASLIKYEGELLMVVATSDAQVTKSRCGTFKAYSIFKPIGAPIVKEGV